MRPPTVPRDARLPSQTWLCAFHTTGFCPLFLARGCPQYGRRAGPRFLPFPSLLTVCLPSPSGAGQVLGGEDDLHSCPAGCIRRAPRGPAGRSSRLQTLTVFYAEMHSSRIWDPARVFSELETSPRWELVHSRNRRWPHRVPESLAVTLGSPGTHFQATDVPRPWARGPPARAQAPPLGPQSQDPLQRALAGRSA